MGMFDDITYEAPCPICGIHLTGWQSKSGACILQNLTPAELWSQRYDDEPCIVPDRVDFYTNCDNCGTWVELNLRGGRVAHSKEERGRVMAEVKSEGLGLKEYYERLGPEKRGPVMPESAPSFDPAWDKSPEEIAAIQALPNESRLEK